MVHWIQSLWELIWPPGTIASVTGIHLRIKFSPHFSLIHHPLPPLQIPSKSFVSPMFSSKSHLMSVLRVLLPRQELTRHLPHVSPRYPRPTSCTKSLLNCI